MVNKKENAASNMAETLTSSEVFMLKYKKHIVIAVVALIVLVAGFFLYKNYVSAPREEKASTELAKGQELFGMQQFEQALNGDKLYAGLCYANLNKWNEAVKYLDSYSPGNDAMVSPAAIAALGNAYAHVGKIDEAIKALKKAADKADSKSEDGTNNSLSPTFLLQAGQLLESQNKKADALKVYQDIKKKYVNSAIVQSQEIDKYIERASR